MSSVGASNMSADVRAPTRLDSLLKLLPRTTTTIKERYRATATDAPTPLTAASTTSQPFNDSSPTVAGTIIGEEDDLSPTIVMDDSSPTDTDWSPKRDLSLRAAAPYYPPPTIHDPAAAALETVDIPFELSGPALFDDVREKFRGGINTLDNLLRYMEYSGPARCRRYRRGIDSLLANLVMMAKWLVGFLETARRSGDAGEGWTRSAVVGLRVDLHQYSWKVMKLSMLLREVGGSSSCFHGGENRRI